MTKVLVTGGAGFIGSNLVDYLISHKNEVVVLDNLSSGKMEFLPTHKIEFLMGDLLDTNLDLVGLLKDVDTVFHLAANADVKDGWAHPRKDLEQNVLATLRLAEAAVEAKVPNFVFISTGSVYGEAKTFPTPESEDFPVQTSLYGASKVSAEAFLEAYAEADKFKLTIFRLVSVLGPRYTHGHVIDFVKQLNRHPEKLTVLGNGFQEKSYMHVSDCVRGIASLRGDSKVEVFNIGTKQEITVRGSVEIITNSLGVQPEIVYGVETQGWIGDNPKILLDVSKAEKHGWVAQKEIGESIRDTVSWLKNNPEYLD